MKTKGPEDDLEVEPVILKFPHPTETLVKPMLSPMERELYEILRSADPLISKVHRIQAIISLASAQAISLAAIDKSSNE